MNAYVWFIPLLLTSSSYDVARWICITLPVLPRRASMYSICMSVWPLYIAEYGSTG